MKLIIPCNVIIKRFYRTYAEVDENATDEDIRKAMIEAILVKVGVDIETANKGQVMKAVMPVLKGKVDMKIANQVIATLLK